MREIIENILDGNEVYRARRDEFATEKKVPFRVSDTPLELTAQEKNELENIGNDVVGYF